MATEEGVTATEIVVTGFGNPDVLKAILTGARDSAGQYDCLNERSDDHGHNG